jgi:FHA domain-containing protein
MTDNARGREIIAQIVENMRSQTEELRYSRVVSSFYNVHLHPDDYARLEGLVPEVVQQARRALDEELERLNRSRPLEDRLRRWIHQPQVPYERIGSEWSISILPDANQELEAGDILVDATLVSSDPERWAGSQTQRIVTHRHGDRVDRRVALAEPDPEREPAPVAAPAPAPADQALATLRWSDRAGEHSFQMVTPSIKIGRGGATYWVDVKLDTVPDVSREHVRIRHDPTTRQFSIQDLSTFGTTVDGAALSSKDAAAPDSASPERPLAPRATIVLAGVVTMSFEAATPS